MKILSKEMTKDEGGRVKLVIQESEDLWHAYNLISPGDHITTKTYRRVMRDTATGTEGEKRLITLTISVKKVDYDPMDDVLRVSGKVSVENKWVKMGSHHTLEVGLYGTFGLWKHEWDEVSMMRMEEAASEKSRVNAGAIVMQEGVANVCVMTESMTLTKVHITQAIPRKRKASQGAHDKSLDKFYQVVYEAMLRVIDLKGVKAMIIASPGFVKDQFFNYLMATAIKSDQRDIIENKSKFMLVHANSGHRHSLNEVLRDKNVVARLSDTKAAGEVAILAKFYDTMKRDADMTAYSKRHVLIASENGAIDDLLLSDALFRARNVSLRREYISLVEHVKAQGGRVHIFSSLHVSGEQLAQLSGVAAILRFPMPDLDDNENDNENDTDHDDLQPPDGATSHDDDDDDEFDPSAPLYPLGPSQHAASSSSSNKRSSKFSDDDDDDDDDHETEADLLKPPSEDHPFGGQSIQVEYDDDDDDQL